MLIDAFVVLYGLRPKVIAKKDASKGPWRRKVFRVYSLYYPHRFCSPHGSNNHKHLVRSACDSTSFPPLTSLFLKTGVQQQQQIQQNFWKLGPKSTSSEYVSKNQRTCTLLVNGWRIVKSKILCDALRLMEIRWKGRHSLFSRHHKITYITIWMYNTYY